MMNHENHCMEKLIGCTVRVPRISGDDSILQFSVQKELGGDVSLVAFEVFGDCCSVSWFSDITGVSNLVDHTVQSLHEYNDESYDVNDGRCRQEVDTAYGIILRTEVGDCTIIFRNSSNGYYGGWMEVCRRHNLPEFAFKIIKGDWKAN